MQEAEVGPVLGFTVFGAEVASEHEFVGLECTANRQLSDAFLCLVCFDAKGEQSSFKRRRLKLPPDPDGEVDLFHVP